LTFILKTRFWSNLDIRFLGSTPYIYYSEHHEYKREVKYSLRSVRLVFRDWTLI
jgi:hypothetical protein